jgi:glycosyltransferase involved in cell wall biosynthesis
MKTKISVVIPTWRRPALLENCLHALSRQQFDAADFEIIVVTDGPDAATMQLATKAAISMNLPNMSCLSLPQKKGPAAARNWGWKRAKSVLVAFTDDDCIPDDDWLLSLWDAYCNHGMPAHIAFTGRIRVPLSDEPTDYEVNTSHLETAAFVTANCCCTKASLQAVGGFDESFTMAWREDSDLEFKLIHKKIPIYNLSDAMVLHPVRSAPWGVSIREQKKSMFNALLYKKFPKLYRQKIQTHPAWHYYIILASFFAVVLAAALQLKWLMVAGAVCYLLFTAWFIIKRLWRTSRSLTHVAEMVFTSIVIPFASVYWTLYGAWKYRVLFF